MTTQNIFDSLDQLHEGTVALARTVRKVLPQAQEAMDNLDECCSSGSHGRVFVRAVLEEVTTPMREVLPALENFLSALEEESPRLADHASLTSHDSPLTREKPAMDTVKEEINFKRFKKLKQFYIVEKTIEVCAGLRNDKDGTGILRLEALRSPEQSGYQVAVYRQVTGPIAAMSDSAGEDGTAADRCECWEAYDLIRSVMPTAEKALEQVLMFLEWRCA